MWFKNKMHSSKSQWNKNYRIMVTMHKFAMKVPIAKSLDYSHTIQKLIQIHFMLDRKLFITLNSEHFGNLWVNNLLEQKKSFECQTMAAKLNWYDLMNGSYHHAAQQYKMQNDSQIYWNSIAESNWGKTIRNQWYFSTFQCSQFLKPYKS